MRLGVSRERVGELALVAYIIRVTLKDLQLYSSGFRHLESTEEMQFLHSDGLMSLLRLCGVCDPHSFIEEVLAREEEV